MYSMYKFLRWVVQNSSIVERTAVLHFYYIIENKNFTTFFCLFGHLLPSCLLNQYNFQYVLWSRHKALNTKHYYHHRCKCNRVVSYRTLTFSRPCSGHLSSSTDLRCWVYEEEVQIKMQFTMLSLSLTSVTKLVSHRHTDTSSPAADRGSDENMGQETRWSWRLTCKQYVLFLSPRGLRLRYAVKRRGFPTCRWCHSGSANRWRGRTVAVVTGTRTRK